MLLLNGFNERKEIPLPTPGELRSEYGLSEEAKEGIASGRQTVMDVLSGIDDRFIMSVGPCSMSSKEEMMAYAERYQPLAEKVSDKIIMLLRAYPHKPRTVIGWPGMIIDPDQDGSCDMLKGVKMVREILRDLAEMGIHTTTEALDNIAHQYIADLVCHSSIGARSVKDALHKGLSSILSAPVGLKNDDSGDILCAVNSLIACRTPQGLFGIGFEGKNDGRPIGVLSKGNLNSHLILRGGKEPNYSRDHISRTTDLMEKAGISGKVMIDCSHDNSKGPDGRKDYRRQADVLRSVLRTRRETSAVFGAMLESDLVAGKQKLDLVKGPRGLVFGQSRTDACIGWQETERLVMEAYHKLSKKRSCSIAGFGQVGNSAKKTISSARLAGW